MDYCTEEVLVMEYVDGISIRDTKRLLENGYDLEEIGVKVMDNYATQIMEHGFFHADPHPGNILVKDGKVIYIDLGIMGRLSVRDRGGFKRIVEAVGSKNSAELKDALITFSVAHDMNAIDHPRFLAELDNVLESYGSTDVADIDNGAYAPVQGYLARFGYRCFAWHHYHGGLAAGLSGKCQYCRHHQWTSSTF